MVGWVPYREESLGRGAVEMQLHGGLQVVVGGVIVWPGGGDAALWLAQIPICLEHFGQVLGQAAAVVDNHSQLLHLQQGCRVLGGPQAWAPWEAATL